MCLWVLPVLRCGAAYKRGGDSSYQRKSALDASVLGLGGGAVHSLGGGAMNFASLLGGGGLQSQMNALAGVLGGSSGLLGTAGVPNELAGLCALLGNQQSHTVTLTNLQVVELQRAVAAQKQATEEQAAALVQAKIDEKVADEMKKVAPGYLPVQPGAAPPETKIDGDGDLSSSRSGSSQGARRRAKHAERADELLTYKEAYEILNGAAGEFHGARGFSSEDDTRGTRSSGSGLRTSLQKARDRIESRDDLVQDVVARLKSTRDSPHQDVSPDRKGHATTL